MPECRECHKKFSVAEEDKKILASLGVPEPSLCYDHNLQQHMAVRNERFLYHRKCERCGKAALAMYSPQSPARIYCKKCFNSDEWNAMEYGRSYDPSRPFFEQYFELLKAVPHINLMQVGQPENSEYTNYAESPKNCYLTFSSLPSEDCVYNINCDYSKDCVDNYGIIKGELLYDCVDVLDSYKCAYLTRSQNCSECYLGRDLTDCQNCFGSVNLKHKQYCWYNEPLTKVEYEKRLLEALKDRASFEKHLQQFVEHEKEYPAEFAVIRSCEDCSGNELHASSRLRNCYHVKEGENCGDTMRTFQVKDSYRFTYGEFSELSYQTQAVQRLNHVISAFMCLNLSFCAYVYNCFVGDNLFGCAGLRKKSFCILNKQYGEEEYRALRAKIVEKMRADGEWGDFFPIQYSLQAYNDSLAQEYFPLTREQAEAKGWRWEKNQGGTRGKETLKTGAVPETIEAVKDDIVKEILACSQCGKNYRIVPKELSVLRAFQLPVPLLCPECRFHKRSGRRPQAKIYPGRCSCEREHASHKGARCPVEFETVYPPSGGGKIFCRRCYQQEIHD